MKRKIYVTISLLLILSACTISFSNTSTHGQASDVGDSSPTTETKTDADIKIPASI